MQQIHYIAFLRAINVGGHSVTMEKLRNHFSELGLTNVGSYIQTGNIFFTTSETDRALLTTKIEQHLHVALGYEVTTILSTITEVETTLELNPFKSIKVTPDIRLCLIFIAKPLSNTPTLPFYSPKKDITVLAVSPGAVYAVLRPIGGKGGNPGAFIEKAFGVRASVRFHATTVKILQAAQKSLT